MHLTFLFWFLQQAIEQSKKQHETDVVEKNRLIRMAADKVFSPDIVDFDSWFDSDFSSSLELVFNDVSFLII